MNFNRETISQFIKQCKRVLIISKRPDREEFQNVAKITGIGIIIIGVIGFIITLVAQLTGFL
jgi:protein transport protein SEC61 subunit gamma-like protein